LLQKYNEKRGVLFAVQIKLQAPYYKNLAADAQIKGVGSLWPEACVRELQKLSSHLRLIYPAK
jgi:hypothetical protein